MRRFAVLFFCARAKDPVIMRQQGGMEMRRLMLLVIVCIVIACLSLYIIDYRQHRDVTLGQQEDSADDEQAASYNAANLMEPKTAHAQVPDITAPAPQPIPAPKSSAPQLQSAAPTTPIPSASPESLEKWALVWADEFDKPSLNMEYWTKVERRDNFNEELQYYTPASVYVKDGMLYLEARDEKRDGKRYISGSVETANKLDFHFGRFEARMSLPVGKGLFPAFWLLAYEDSYEIDVLEMIGSEPNLVYGVNHYLKRGNLVKNVGMTTVDDPEAFHVYAVEWDKETLKWYVDDELYYTTKRGVPDGKMYMILTLAVGGVWPGDPNRKTEFPSCLAVDYVRYYMPSETAGTGESNDSD